MQQKGMKRGAQLAPVMPCGSLKEQENETSNIKKNIGKPYKGHQTRPDVPEGTVAISPNTLLNKSSQWDSSQQVT